jgi:hypothetical protein
MEQELQALRNWVDCIDPSGNSIDWSRIKHSVIVGNSLELFQTKEEMEARKLHLVMVDKNPNFTVLNHD